jgi:UTP--glucose-1-phosphate uridylyltransferase
MIKAVITAAGKGTRLLPITKELPKEMMPIFSKIYGNQRAVIPVLQYIFEQLYVCNLRDYCFVVGREKRSIEDHFTPHESYLKEIPQKDRVVIESFYKRLENSHLVWVNQNKPRGFGDAVLRTERYVNNDNFIVHAGDVVIVSKSKHPISRLIESANKDPTVEAVLLCKKIKDAKRYGVPKIKTITKDLFMVEEVEEKPSKPKSNFGLLPLYFFRSGIFASLKKIKPGKGNEYQLTDAIQKLIEDGHKVVAIPLNHNEFELDVGTVESYKHSLDLSYNIA